MAIHVLRRIQIVNAPLAECWEFFSNPRNLALLTPPGLDFEMPGELPATVYPGLMIELRVRPLFGIPATWLTEITHVEPATRFVDEQRVGPFALWHHEHRFTALADGRTEICDAVHYVLPFGWLGNLAHPLLVAPKLQMTFAFRERAVAERFGC